MKPKHILKFSFSLLLLIIFCQSVYTQEKDTIVPIKTERYGLRLGVDLQRLAKTIYDSNFKGFEVVGDYRISKKLYITAEIGAEDKNTNDTRLNFTTKGSYIKAGIDFNTYENWLDMENLIYVGLRYSVSTFSQKLNDYKIYYDTTPEGNTLPTGRLTTSTYFEDNSVIINKTFNGLSAHWIEVVAGIKAEVLDNLFLGFSLRLNTLLFDKKPNNFDNLYIPGFNRTYEGRFGVGYNYTISYFIPFKKKKIITE